MILLTSSLSRAYKSAPPNLGRGTFPTILYINSLSIPENRRATKIPVK